MSQRPDQRGDALEIRAVQDADIPAVIRLWGDCGLVVPWNDPEADIALARRSADAEVFVGLAGGDIVASAMAGSDGHRGWLYYVAVGPARRGEGFGRLIVRHAEAWLARRGVPKMQLMIRDSNTEVHGFYQSLGYRDVPRVVMERWFKEPGR